MSKGIVYYDAECPMCIFWIRKMLAWDTRGRVQFAPLQGKTALKHLSHQYETYLKMDTVIYETEGHFYLQSAAVIKSLSAISPYGWLRWFLHGLSLLPKGWMDRIYNTIAQNRKRVMKSCATLPSEYNDRFLP